MSQNLGGPLESLLQRAGEGDQQAQAELLDRYRERLKRMVAIRLDKRVAARVDASDIVQETMHDAHQRLPAYFSDPQIPFFPWLRRIAWDRLTDLHRMHIDAARRSVLREHTWATGLSDESLVELAHGIVTSSIVPSRRAEKAETEARIQASLLELNPPDREILILRYLEQMSVAEIATELGVSQTVITSRHLRALQRLRRLLGPDL